MQTLPEQFLDLVPLCEKWCLANSAERQHTRVHSSMEEINAFHAAIIDRAPAALEYLSTRTLGNLTPAEGNLLSLMLSLAEIGPAIEWFGQPRVIDGYEEEKFPITLEIPDLDAQTL